MLKGILSISGQPGLYKLVSQTTRGLIVESLETKKRTPVFSSAKVSALEDIAIFTDDEEIPLKDVFKNIYEHFGSSDINLNKNSSKEELVAFFGKVLPNYDRDRVYISDIKKVVNWYSILKERELLIFDETNVAENKSEDSDKKEEA